MSYNIKFDDITSVQVESQKTMNAWGESMSSLNKAMNDSHKESKPPRSHEYAQLPSRGTWDSSSDTGQFDE